MPTTEKRLKTIYQNAAVIPFDYNSKFILMSDCHRGQGNSGDNFLFNQNLFFGALEYYNQHRFTYIELGDGDELWENRKIEPIIDIHSDAFWLMSQFYKDHRFYMLSGNHDAIKNRTSFMQKHCSNYYCQTSHAIQNLFPGIQIHQGLILENKTDKTQLFLTHGHQGDLLNDTLWPIARFLVRYIWSPLEMIGFIAPTGSGRSHQKWDKVEKRLAAYANKQQRILIAGHTHRPVFPVPGKSYYFNDGSCVHPRCITGIEIEHNQISLVKWHVCTDAKRNLYVCRTVLDGPEDIASFYQKR